MKFERPTFVANLNGERTIYYPFGFIEFYQDKNSGQWTLFSIEVKNNQQNKGFGKQMIRDFVSHVGSDQNISVPITDKLTRHQLIENGYMDYTNSNRPLVEISDQAILSTLRIVRVLNGGGIQINRLQLIYEEEANGLYEDGFSIGLQGYGKT